MSPWGGQLEEVTPQSTWELGNRMEESTWREEWEGTPAGGVGGANEPHRICSRPGKEVSGSGQ